jgi:hypothetical protein
MNGVTTAVVAFIFLCLAMPSLIKYKNQYYVAFLAVVGVIFLDAVAHMIPPSVPAAQAVCYVLGAIAQIIAVVMLFLATGGLTFRALQGDMIEVLRRDGQKEVIVPLSEEAKKKIRENQETAERKVKTDEEPKVYKIETPPPPAVSPVPTPKPPEHGPLPLE